jgi:hypothetical protein
MQKASKDIGIKKSRKQSEAREQKKRMKLSESSFSFSTTATIARVMNHEQQLLLRQSTEWEYQKILMPVA